MRRLILLVLVAALAAPLAACGRKGPPTPPEGADPNYPRSYPSGATPAK
jgi:predicted small lipoprotein YifL